MCANHFQAQTGQWLSGQRCRDVLEAHVDLVCRYLPDTTLTFVNAAYCAYFGRSPDELLGRRFIELVPEAQRGALLEHVQSAITHGAAANIHETQRPDGSIAYHEWLDRAIVDLNGRVIELQSVGRDVSRFVAAQQELEAQRANVTHLSRVALLGRLSGAFAHELRQPLTAILSNAQAAQRILRNHPEDLAQVRDILDDIVADDVRMGEVIARLGLLLKKRDVEMQPIVVDKLVLTALDLARGMLGESSVSVRTVIAENLPAVQGDPVQLRQVVLNFLINAIEAVGGNGPSDRLITLSAARADTRQVVVGVSDNGAGISDGALARLFEPFITTKPHGLGLGLSICRAIIEAHHGTISARRNSTRGTTFTFTLPVADTAGETAAAR